MMPHGITGLKRVNYIAQTAVPKTSNLPVQRKLSPAVIAGATKSTNQDQHTIDQFFT
jgi:hypothetical protein